MALNVFTRFDPQDIVGGMPSEITTGLWSGDTGSLNAFFSYSVEASTSVQGQYYWDVYQTDPNITSSLPIPQQQFAIAYGNINGNGAPTLAQNQFATLSTLATYVQYRNILLDPDETNFVFLGNYVANHIYVLNIYRAQLRQQMDAGNWNLIISGSSGSFSFIDDSGQTLDPALGKAGNIFNVVSGSLTGVSGSTIVASQSANFGGWGLFYPTVGIIVLNPDAISATCGFVSGGFYTSGSKPFSPVTGSSTLHQYNHAALYNAIKLGGLFEARSRETVTTTNFFVRVRNQEYNYSNNPTFFNSNTGALIFSTFANNPVVFITTVGLYDDSNELLAVAKLSQPTPKDFTKELLMRVQLQF